MKTGREKFKRNKRIVSFFVKTFKCFPKPLLIFLWDCTSRNSQLAFIGLRYMILKSLIKGCGDNVRIGTNVQIVGWENLELGTNVSIHANCYIDASGGILIGDEVSIAHNSTILSSNHDWKEIDVPIKYNPIVLRPVKIENDVWIGCGCRILSGVVIHGRSIIAAGAVVNKNVESNRIVGGVPAKTIKDI